MSEPRFTREDLARFRLPYVKASAMHDDYLKERMKLYREMVKAERANVEPIAKGKRK